MGMILAMLTGAGRPRIEVGGAVPLVWVLHNMKKEMAS